MGHRVLTGWAEGGGSAARGLPRSCKPHSLPPRDHPGPQDTQYGHCPRIKAGAWWGGSSSLLRAEQGTEIGRTGRGLSPAAGAPGSGTRDGGGQARGWGSRRVRKEPRPEAEGTSKCRVHPPPAPGKAPQRCMHDGGGAGSWESWQGGWEPGPPSMGAAACAPTHPMAPRTRSVCAPSTHSRAGQAGPTAYRGTRGPHAAAGRGTPKSQPWWEGLAPRYWPCTLPPAPQEAQSPGRTPPLPGPQWGSTSVRAAGRGRAALCCPGSGAGAGAGAPSGSSQPWCPLAPPALAIREARPALRRPPAGPAGRELGPGFTLRRQCL